MQEDNGLTVKEAARVIGVSESALRLWKRQRRGPRYYRAGRLVRYRKSDLDTWIEKQSCEPWQGEDDNESKE